MTTITKRVSDTITDNSVRRVLTSGVVAGAPATIGGDTWGGTWGNTWGRTWYNGTPAATASPASPAVDVTKRVTGV